MTLQTDPREVERLAKEREDENWNFRSFLKGINLESNEIDAVVHKHYEAVSSKIDCRACGNCCHKVLPILRAADVERLSSGLNLSKEELKKRFLVPGEEPETFTFNQTPCPFLAEKRCTAYTFRPDDCRSFPHLHKNEFASRLIQVVANCAICPIVFNVFESVKDELWHDPDDVGRRKDS